MWKRLWSALRNVRNCLQAMRKPQHPTPGVPTDRALRSFAHVSDETTREGSAVILHVCVLLGWHIYCTSVCCWGDTFTARLCVTGVTYLLQSVCYWDDTFTTCLCVIGVTHLLHVCVLLEWHIYCTSLCSTKTKTMEKVPIYVSPQRLKLFWGIRLRH